MGHLHIVGIGGGTGLPAVLAGLTNRPGVTLSAIVSVADNGGSSGRLRDGFGMPAVGDLRNCLVALSNGDSALASLFQHRFDAGGCLEGHSLGNLIVAALYQRTGSMSQSVEQLSQMLRVQGSAMAATEVATTLCAALRDGRIVRGESQVSEAGGAIERIWMEPANPPASGGVLETIRSADVIAFAPGSLYTSLIPNLLVDGVADAIRESDATRIMVCNIATQPGETDGYSAAEHLRTVQTYLGDCLIHHCIVNSPAPRSINSGIAADVQFVRYDPAAIAALGSNPVPAQLLASSRADGKIRHDSEKLGNLIVELGISSRETETVRRQHFASFVGAQAMRVAQPAVA